MKIVLFILLTLVAINIYADYESSDDAHSNIQKEVDAVPVTDSDGTVTGFKVVSIKGGSMYQKIGLKKGDIIKGVDGEPVDDPQKAMELYQELKKQNP